MPHVLFVCTGNVFRSLTAELALKSILPPESGITVASAGTRGRSDHEFHPATLTGLALQGLDASRHVSRLLTQELLDEADVVVAMSKDYSDFIKATFQKDVPLFLRIADGRDAHLRDVWEVVANHEQDVEGSKAFIHKTIQDIVGYTPALLKNLPAFLAKPGPAPGPSTPSP